ncbi:glycosyltransferase [Candidatus Parcubacteria bacterium]|nr:glycosyltransferase [Candidatus Parcubacteria bacterium]
MKMSIITISLNSANFIEDAIESVLAQDYKNVEYIVIDGGSTDGTLEIIEKYRNNIAKIISEPDNGIYDAMNKGIKISSGDIIGFLNSDDFYIDNKALTKIADCFTGQKIDGCYGNLIYIDRLNKNMITRYWKAGKCSEKKIKRGWIIPHPAFFVKKEMYNKYGLFNSKFLIAADYELMLRFIKKNKIKLFYLDQNLVCMREGGYSATNIQQRIKGWGELYQAWRINGLKPPLFLFFNRPFFKLRQYFTKP